MQEQVLPSLLLFLLSSTVELRIVGTGLFSYSFRMRYAVYKV